MAVCSSVMNDEKISNMSLSARQQLVRQNILTEGARMPRTILNIAPLCGRFKMDDGATDERLKSREEGIVRLRKKPM